mmetsp:Transcript_23728/g.68271  ORF Transcript_23728/g.68271 Transcript_23728/m.68271 type:complete len:112 (+) Transcript_23728:456-791(+)
MHPAWEHRPAEACHRRRPQRRMRPLLPEAVGPLVRQAPYRQIAAVVRLPVERVRSLSSSFQALAPGRRATWWRQRVARGGRCRRRPSALRRLAPSLLLEAALSPQTKVKSL